MKIHEQTIRFNEVMQILVNMKKEKSIRAIAVSIGQCPQSIHEVKKGRRNVTVKMIKGVAETYGINPSYVFGLTNEVFFINESTISALLGKIEGSEIKEVLITLK